MFADHFFGFPAKQSFSRHRPARHTEVAVPLDHCQRRALDVKSQLSIRGVCAASSACLRAVMSVMTAMPPAMLFCSSTEASNDFRKRPSRTDRKDGSPKLNSFSFERGRGSNCRCRVRAGKERYPPHVCPAPHRRLKPEMRCIARFQAMKLHSRSNANMPSTLASISRLQ